jgi:PAS domain S-box-containing protein
MSAKPPEDFPLGESIPEGAASLESILCTEELRRRPSRPPDYEKENRALVSLASAFADSPSTIFRTLAETILDVTESGSAGLSLLTKDGKTPDVGGGRFYWPAIAGMWNPHVGGGTPRNFGPCGDVLDQNRTLLFKHFERRYPYLLPVAPAAEECLLVPLYVAGKAVGTIWAIAHSDRHKFDAEDDRVMASLGKFASSAYQALAHIEDLKIQVAEREKAETALRELARGLEAKVQRLVDANVIGIVIFNLAGAITEANEAFLQMVQYSREDLVTGRMRWTDLTPAEWSDRDQMALAELRTTGVFQTYEKEYFRKDGDRAPVLLGGALFEKGGSEGVAFVLELSEQKQAVETLHRVEQQARSIVDSALDGVIAMDADGIITDWNNEAEKIFGWTRLEAMGRRMSETIIPMRYRPAHEKGLRHFFHTGEGPVLNKRIEISALRRNGEEFPVELSITPLKFGETWIFSGFVRDISDRKRAEEQLRTSELNLRRMTETIPEMLWSATPDGAVDYCNARVLESTGLAQDEIAGAGWMKTIHPDDAGNTERAWAHSVRTGDPFQAEFRCLRGLDGTYRWCVSRALPLRRSDGSILKWYGTIVDFHDRRQAQEDLRNTQAELAHVNRVMTMGELAASIAHEVNQPLASIIASGDSCTAWLANEPPNLERARAAASRVIQAATQATEIVQRIRALFKKTTASTTPVSVNAVIEDTISLLRHETQRHNISLLTELEPDVPSVLADRVQLQQVILNLVMNAIESTASVDRERRRLVIRSALSNPGELLVAVKDTGPGIEAQQAERLFAPFFTTKPQGIGMGLPISRSIIEAHGGRLWAEKNEPHGAVFQFVLPTRSQSQ